ncbi:hypothetical protein V2G26_016305 [Clonostachys chloroleuca]
MHPTGNHYNKKVKEKVCLKDEKSKKTQPRKTSHTNGGHTTTPESVSGYDIPHSCLHAGCGYSLAKSSQKAALEDHRAHAEEQTYSSWRWKMPHPSPKYHTRKRVSILCLLLRRSCGQVESGWPSASVLLLSPWFLFFPSASPALVCDPPD